MRYAAIPIPLPAFFALNLDVREPRHIADRMNLTRACLADIGAI
jgi:hypothetical protein